MTGVERAVRSAERAGEQTLQLAQALVRAHTVNRHSGDAQPGNEANGQRLLEPLLRDLGARVELFDCPPDIYDRMGVLGPRDREFADRPNLVADLTFGAGGPTILLQGHMDTVGIDDMRPAEGALSGDIHDGRLWGRGSSDMKGGLAAAMTALQLLHERRSELRGRVLFASVVEEESNGSGAGALALIARAGAGRLFGGSFQSRRTANGQLLLADAAVCADGTGPQVTRGYGGVLTVNIGVVGRSGHAAGADSVSAIDKALIVKRGIDRYRDERAAEGPGRQVNLGVFRGGVHPAVVPGHAQMSLNMSYPFIDAVAAEAAGQRFGNAPGRRRFEEFIRAACAADSWMQAHPPEVRWIKDLIPFELPEDHPLVQQLAAAHRVALGEKATVDVNPAWSDACYLAPFAATPALCYGAGTPGEAHSASESAETWRIAACAKVLTAFLYARLKA
ncbi:MAG TPA: M20/M25/M40 family metallo-hydrolase [Chloroflexota bacterium]